MGFLMYLSKKENFPHNNKTYSYKLSLQQEKKKKKKSTFFRRDSEGKEERPNKQTTQSVNDFLFQ